MVLVLWKASVTSNEELCGQSHQHVLKLPIGCIIGQKNLFAKNFALHWRRLKRGARAVRVFGHLAVLGTHILRY